MTLARKILCILHHLLIHREKYQEPGNTKAKSVKIDWTSSPIKMTEQDMIDVLANAGYIISRKDNKGVHITHIPYPSHGVYNNFTVFGFRI